MRKTFLFVLVIACLFSFSAWAQISMVHVTQCGPQIFPATTCAIPATGSGNLLVVAWMSGGPSGETTTLASVTDGAGNIYSEAGNARSFESTSHLMADVWYAKNSRAGATAITITPNPSAISGEAVIWEFSGADMTAPLDQSAVLNSVAATTAPSGAPVTTTASSGVVISIVQVQDKVTGLASGNSFTNDSVLFGNGWAHLGSSSSGTYTAQWISTLGAYSSSTVAFKASGSSSSAGACDLNADGIVNSLDAQLETNMILGSTPCTGNVVGSGVCNAVVLQRVINAALGGSCSVGNPHKTLLSWTASTSANVTGYNIYRSATSGGPYTKLNSSLLAGTSYTDTTVQAGQNYYYVATDVDNTGTESANSNQTQAVIPTP